MPEPDPPVSTTTMLEEVQAIDPDFMKKPKVYEFSNGRQFEDGDGPYAAN